MADMSEVLRNMAQATSRRQRIRINRKGAHVFEEALRQNYNTSMSEKNPAKHGTDDDVISTLTTDTTAGGAVGVGFSAKGKKSYLARFQNDGWIPRNQHGGPYKYHRTFPMVPGAHFWEKTYNDSGVDRRIGEAQKKEFENIMKRATRGDSL